MCECTLNPLTNDSGVEFSGRVDDHIGAMKTQIRGCNRLSHSQERNKRIFR